MVSGLGSILESRIPDLTKAALGGLNSEDRNSRKEAAVALEVLLTRLGPQMAYPLKIECRGGLEARKCDKVGPVRDAVSGALLACRETLEKEELEPALADLGQTVKRPNQNGLEVGKSGTVPSVPGMAPEFEWDEPFSINIGGKQQPQREGQQTQAASNRSKVESAPHIVPHGAPGPGVRKEKSIFAQVGSEA